METLLIISGKALAPGSKFGFSPSLLAQLSILIPIAMACQCTYCCTFDVSNGATSARHCLPA